MAAVFDFGQQVILNRPGNAARYKPLQATLCDLHDGELKDMGIARGEVDHVGPLCSAKHPVPPSDECLAV